MPAAHPSRAAGEGSSLFEDEKAPAQSPSTETSRRLKKAFIIIKVEDRHDALGHAAAF